MRPFHLRFPVAFLGGGLMPGFAGACVKRSLPLAFISNLDSESKAFRAANGCEGGRRRCFPRRLGSCQLFGPFQERHSAPVCSRRRQTPPPRWTPIRLLSPDFSGPVRNGSPGTVWPFFKKLWQKNNNNKRLRGIFPPFRLPSLSHRPAVLQALNIYPCPRP